MDGLGKTLFDERVGPVLVLLVDDCVGGCEDVEVAVCAGDFGGGGLGLFVANLFHFLISVAIDVGHSFGAAAHCGVGGWAERPIADRGKSLSEIIDDALQSFGDAFVGSGGG